MKIKVVRTSPRQVLSSSVPAHVKPERQSALLRGLINVLSAKELKEVGFTCRQVRMDLAAKDRPCLYLMNHSSFIDLKIAFRLISPKPFHIICTSDGFVGKYGLMCKIGCIPTRKFTTDFNLVKDISYTLKTLKSSVLMYPEASYSFDGTETPLPESLGKLIKMLKVPVVVIMTEGAFLRDPLYNGLRLRKTRVSATEECLLTAEEIGKLSPGEINSLLKQRFSYDHFRVQQEKQVEITEPFRAIGLERALYKCPACGTEGEMLGEGCTIRCRHCGKEYELTTSGFLKATEGETEFDHIPDWYRWERDCVRKELEAGEYRLEYPVTIRIMSDFKAIYEVGEGVLTHTGEGFLLHGCEGLPEVKMSPRSSYGLYSDFFWYELGDMICISDGKLLYYCFPHCDNALVAKARLAAEENYKLLTAK